MLTEIKMNNSETTLAHHPNCPWEYAWDVVAEHGAACTCPRFWPHQVCTECWMPPKRHLKSCSRFVRKVKDV